MQRRIVSDGEKSGGKRDKNLDKLAEASCSGCEQGVEITLSSNQNRRQSDEGANTEEFHYRYDHSREQGLLRWFPLSRVVVNCTIHSHWTRASRAPNAQLTFRYSSNWILPFGRWLDGVKL